MSLKNYIEQGDIDGIKNAIKMDPDLVDKVIKWGTLLKNKSHPLHYLSDQVFAGKLNDKTAGKIAQLLIDEGVQINGYGFEELKDTPLTAAASLHADEVALALIEAGADIHHGGCYGGTALHWAAWCGRDRIVKRLLQEDINLDRRCITHKSTAFFWAAHGIAEGGEKNLHRQLECAKMLKEAGADTSIPNINNITARELLNNNAAFLDLLSS